MSNYNYAIYILMMMMGLFAMIGKRNLVKKLLGLSVFQTAIILFFLSLSVKTGGQVPVLDKHAGVPDPDVVYMNPLPHVLMLTAIVVGVATMALGLALIVRIRESYGTIEEDELTALDRKEARELTDDPASGSAKAGGGA